MKSRRFILWGAALGVLLLLATWFLTQPPEELEAWLTERSAPRPVNHPPPPPQKRVGPCVGVTWTLLSQEKLFARVGPAGQASCDTELSVLCFNGSELAVTTPMPGKALSARVIGDAACMSRMGVGWRMFSARDVPSGKGELPAKVHFWVAGDALLNPWD